MAVGLTIFRAAALRAVTFVAAPLAAFWLYTIALDRLGGLLALVAGALPFVGLLGWWLDGLGRRRRADRRALGAAELGTERSGWVAVSGTLEALGEPFAAPISHQPALASRYQVFEEHPYAGMSTSDTRRPRRSLVYEGYRLAPTAIATDSGRVELRGFPDLTDVQDTGIGSGTPFTVDELAVRIGPLARALERARLFSEPRREARIDWQVGAFEDPERMLRKEKLLRPGDPVCALGQWQDGALVPNGSRPRGLPVYPGSADQVFSELGKDGDALTLTGRTLLAAAVAGIALVFLV